jgi:hypothetical protein
MKRLKVLFFAAAFIAFSMWRPSPSLATPGDIVSIQGFPYEVTDLLMENDGSTAFFLTGVAGSGALDALIIVFF